MGAGRKRKCRTLEIQVDKLPCKCFGPLQTSSTQTVELRADEYQAIIYQDIDNLTMDTACAKMGISKTVYAGLYKSARNKLARMLHDNATLTIVCPEQ
ncbi:MAG: DUF134 domain-containing protein [Candidatus Absconditabacterales bacterium]